MSHSLEFGSDLCLVVNIQSLVEKLTLLLHKLDHLVPKSGFLAQSLLEAWIVG